MLVAFTSDAANTAQGFDASYTSTLPTGVVYGYKAFDPVNGITGPVFFDLANPGTLTLIDDQSSLDFLSGGSWVNGTWYACDFVSDELVTVDPSTGARTIVGPLGVHFDGMSYDPTTGTMYGVNINGSLYTVDLSSGAATPVNITSGNLLVTLACSPSGQLYSLDVGTDELVSIDKGTGLITSIGAIGFDANFAQDMEFDGSTGILYMTAYNNTLSQGELRTANTTTGASTLVGVFENQAEITGFAIPSNTNPFPPVIPTNESAIILGQAQIDGIPATGSDWIGVFDNNGNIAGSAQLVENMGIAYISVVVYGDDPFTTTVDEGMNAGETFSLQLFDVSNNEYLGYPTFPNLMQFFWVDQYQRNTLTRI